MLRYYRKLVKKKYLAESYITCLVAKSMSPNNDRFNPSRNRLGNALKDDWFTEHSASEDVANLMIVNIIPLFKIRIKGYLYI